MAETALKFGPQWLRDLAHGNSGSPPVSPEASTSQDVPSSEAPQPPPPPAPKYKLAEFRYGREEMLALYSKNFEMPECLEEFDFLVTDKNQFPLALVPISEEEQRLLTRSVNSDAALRVSGKTPTGPGGNGMMRTSRGGSVDRGRGRGRGGYYQRGISFEEGEEGQSGNFSRLKPMERSQSASEKDQAWEDRDRRFERNHSFPVRGLETSNSSSNVTKEGIRAPNDNWRRTDKDDDAGWRTAGGRNVDNKFGGRSNSWRNHDRDRNKAEYDGKDKSQQVRENIMNGPARTKTQNSRPRTQSSSNVWDDDDNMNDNLPEWSVEEPAVSDAVGTFDSSGAFMETKEMSNSTASHPDVYVSDEEEAVKRKVTPVKTSAPAPPNKGIKSNIKISPPQPIPQIPAPTPRKPPLSESPPHRPEKQKTVPVMEPLPSRNHNTSSSPPRQQQNLPSVVHPIEDQTARNVCCSNEHKEEPIISSPAISNIMSSDACGQACAEDDAFAHHKKATENMMAQWTAEEETRVISETVAKNAVLDLHHEDAHKWFYRDPQADIQGPFLPTEMSDWFKAGYFTMNLLVRRGCDERFMQLGELMQLWGRVPFSPGKSPPPLRVTASSIAPPQQMPGAAKPLLSNPSLSNQASSAPLSQTDAQLRIMQQQQQQLLQQLMQQQLLLRQAQVQQLMSQLKHQDAFCNLNSQQQSQLIQHLLQHYQQQQVPRPGGFPENTVPALPFPIMGLQMPSLTKNDLSLWSLPSSSANAAWPVSQSSSLPSGGIWDTDAPSTSVPIKASELEKQFVEEEEKKRRQALEAAKRLEEEKKMREEEELRKKKEEERLKELQRQKEEEERRIEELKRLREEELTRQKEIRRLEDIRKVQERQLEELRKQEEERKQEEHMKQLEEQRKFEDQRRQAELEQRRQVEQEEQRRQEASKREEQKRLKELKRQEEKKRQEEAKALEEEQLEVERQKELQTQKEQELKAQKELERERQLRREAQNKKEAELREMQEQKGPVWNVQNSDRSSNELSLSDIQKLQEREREEKERLRQQQQQMLSLQQQNLKQAQATKNGLSWAKKSSSNVGSVKSLAEIQQEEARQMAQQQKVQKTAASTLSAKVQQAPPPSSGGSVWGSSSQIRPSSSSAPGWNAGGCFWDSTVKSTASAQKPTKTTESAFPALNNSIKPASSMNSNKNKNVRAKKEQDAVLKIFETHRKPTDEFTGWCTEALSSMPSLVDVPTFVAFLKDVESPYEVHDYVRSYLGETKEAQEFSKQFLEKRSKFRNQSKQIAEENMWGPAPALTPSINKTAVPSIADCDGTTNTKGKAKKKKNRMQKLDSSMLGFTVQANPDRINVGEMDHVEGM